jgi:two-component system, CitB family, response regulator CitB
LVPGDNIPLPTNHSRRVLIAEEEKPVADLFSLSLQEMGCHVRVSSQEAQIRDGIIRWKPDLLVLDLFLTGCSGLDLLREFKTLGVRLGRPFPIMVVSALGFWEVVEQARALGAVDFILKPVDLDNFRQKALMYLP